MIGIYDAIATRLAVRCAALLQVDVAMSPDALELFALQAAVTALVHPIADEATPIREGGFIVSQAETWSIGVTLALAYPGGFPEFEPARDQVKAALRGWMPEGCAVPIAYAGGRVTSYSLNKDGGLWTHLLRFRTTVQESYEHQS